MSSSMFDTFGSQNFPSNPSVPPSAPPGFSAPSSAANPAKVSPPMTSAQIASLQSALQDNNIAQIVQAVTGAYTPGAGTAFSQLESWANGIYGDISGYVESLASSLTGIETAAWNDITDVFTDVENWAKQLFGSFQQLQTWWNSLINGLLGSSGGGTGTVYDLTLWLQNAETNAANAWTAIEDFLHTGDWSDLSTAWQDIIQAIFGSSTSTGLWGWIPSTAVTSQTQNPQPVSNFPNSASIVAGGGWSWDSTVSFETSSGSALFAASGVVGALRGVVVPVQPAQVAELSAAVKWSGLSAASGTSPIQLQIVPWSSTGGLNPEPETPGTPIVLAEITSPGAASVGWDTISNQYTVPGSGVGFVQTRLVVTADATAGSVWWDDCTTTITGGFLPQLAAGVGQLQADAAASNAATQTFLTAIKTATTADAGNIPQWFTDVGAAYQAWAATESGLLTSEFATLEQMAQGLLGINPSTGLYPQSQIAGLVADGANWTAAYDNLSNFLTTWSWSDLTAAWTDLNNALWGGGSGAVGANIQHAALPSTYTNIHTDLQNLFNDVIFAGGRTWADIGADVSTLINDLVGSSVSLTITPGQVPAASVAPLSPSGGSSLGDNVQTTLDNLATYFQAGYPVTGQTTTQAANAMSTLANTVSGLSATVQANQTQATGNSQSGNNFQVAFAQYPDGAFSSTPFTTTYTGSGTGGLVISGGKAVWNAVNDGDRSVVAIYSDGVTLTDYQELQASLGGYPNGTGSKNYAILRANAAGTSYVYGLVYLNSSFQLCWEIGCYVSGTQNVFATGTNAPLNLNFTFRAGVGTEPYRFQGISGRTVVFDYTDSSNVSQLGSTYRSWGFRSDTAASGATTPAPAAYVGCADNQPPTIPGYGLRMYRTSTASVTHGYAAGLNNFVGTNYFDTIDEISPGLSQLTTNVGSALGASYPCIQVATGGRYIASLRTDIYSATTGSGAITLCPAIQRYNSAGTLQESRLFPSGSFFVNGFGAQYNSGFVGGEQVIGCQDGDILQACYYLSAGPVATPTGYLSALAFTGEASGSDTYFELTLASRSFS